MNMYWWELKADVSDPQTGQIISGEGTVATSDIFQPGQTVKVRWSAKRKAFDLYTRSNVPEYEWEADVLGHQGATSAAGTTGISDVGLSPDQTARCSRRLAGWVSAVPRVSRWYACRALVLVASSLIRSSRSRSSSNCATMVP